MPGHQTLKVDATALFFPEKDRENKFLVIFNVNVPERIVNDDNEYPLVLERIRDLLIAEFQVDNNVGPIYYQITATYYLVHKISGASRVWTGSFFPKGNSPAQLAPFRQFDPANFVNHVLQNTTPESIEAKLNWTEQDSNWQFDSLASVIINAQTNVLVSHSVLTRRNLIAHGGRRRLHQTFAL